MPLAGTCVLALLKSAAPQLLLTDLKVCLICCETELLVNTKKLYYKLNSKLTYEMRYLSSYLNDHFLMALGVVGRVGKVFLTTYTSVHTRITDRACAIFYFVPSRLLVIWFDCFDCLVISTGLSNINLV